MFALSGGGGAARRTERRLAKVEAALKLDHEVTVERARKERLANALTWLDHEQLNEFRLLCQLSRDSKLDAQLNGRLEAYFTWLDETLALPNLEPRPAPEPKSWLESQDDIRQRIQASYLATARAFDTRSRSG